MKKRILWTSVAMMTILACVLAAQTVTAPKTEQKVIVVPGAQDWVGTGYAIGPGDRVTLKAMGRVYFNDNPGSSVGPNGFPGTYKTDWADDFAAGEDPLPKESHACLSARINDEKFKVGSGLTFSGKTGLLFIGINDCTLTGKYGNTGNFGVNVKVERDAVPVKK